MNITASTGKTGPSSLLPSMDKRLVAYVLGAAGVAAIAPPANASIVYTKVNVTISQGILPIDLNQDGKPDFALHNYFVGTSSSVQAITMRANPSDSQAAVIGRKQTIFHYASALPLNYSIGSGISKRFVNLQGGNHAYINGGITNRFLGLRFSISGQIHYGWARITTKGGGLGKLATVQLTGFAYETNPNTTILAGDRGPSADASVQEPPAGRLASLSLLSLGAAGLSVWRREDS